MYGYERVCNMLEKRKRKTKMKKKKSINTCRQRKKFIFDNKEKTPSSIYLSLSCYKTKISIMIIINSTFSPLPNNNNNHTLLSKSIHPNHHHPNNPLQIPPPLNIHPQRRLLPNQKNLLIQPPLTLPPQPQIKIQQRRSQNQSHFIPSKILSRATSRTRTKRLKSLQMIVLEFGIAEPTFGVEACRVCPEGAVAVGC